MAGSSDGRGGSQPASRSPTRADPASGSARVAGHAPSRAMPPGVDVCPVHGHFFSGLYREWTLSSGSAREAGRSGQQLCNRYWEMPRRSCGFHLPWNRHSCPGRPGACAVRTGSDLECNRRTPAAIFHADSVWRNDGGPDNADTGVHGVDADAHHAAVLPVQRALPAAGAARMADVLTPGATRLPARFTRCSGGLPPPEHLARDEGGAVPGRHMERAGGPLGVWLGIAAVTGGAMLGKAIAEFRRTE
jgi:hypothetical protein